MHIPIIESNKYGSLTLENLKAFETRLGTRLPESYRRFLLKHNGGRGNGAKGFGYLHHFFGIHQGPNWSRLSHFAELNGIIPNGFLPIATNPCGDEICLCIFGANRGAVYFWNHEAGPEPSASLTKLADGFKSFQRGFAVKVAIARKRLKVIRRIVKEVGVDVPVYGGQTLLDLAFEQGSLRMVKLLVAAGARIRSDALIEAVRNGARNTVNYLVQRGLDINFAIPETGFTALMLAASCNTTEIVEMLLDHGAKTDFRNRWGKTAADLAHSDQMRAVLASRD